MYLTLDSMAGSHIAETCKQAIQVAAWASRFQKIAPPPRSGSWNPKWLALAPEKDDPYEYHLLWSWDYLEDEDEDDGDPTRWFAFWNRLKDKYGQDKARECILVKLEHEGDGEGDGDGSEKLPKGGDLTVRFVFNEAEVLQPVPIDLPLDETTLNERAAALQAQWDETMEANRKAYWTPERTAEAERQQKEHEAKTAARRVKLNAVVEKFPFKPAKGLADEYAESRGKNTDPYGAAVYRYLEGWAALMNAGLAEGKTVEEIAKDTSHEADVEGITGFMYGASVSILAHFWEHGEALRRWHNLDTQLGNEGEKANESGGVLNPALLNVNVSEDAETEA